MYLAKTLTLRSLPEIGRRFGGRDHTTVLHAVRKIEGLVGKRHRAGRGDRVAEAPAAGVASRLPGDTKASRQDSAKNVCSSATLAAPGRPCIDAGRAFRATLRSPAALEEMPRCTALNCGGVHLPRRA